MYLSNLKSMMIKFIIAINNNLNNSNNYHNITQIIHFGIN